MYARGNRLYGLILAGALLLAGCSGDDMPVPPVPPATEPVAIAFDFAQAGYGAADGFGTRTTVGHEGAMDSEDLYYTGFGVFASQHDDLLPDMMYNQEVRFTFIGDLDNPLRGSWSYAPVKYWPVQSSLTNFTLCAYAPYVAVAGDISDPDATGIIGMSANNEPPTIRYRRSLHPERNVDLLWCHSTPRTIPAATATAATGTLSMVMRHALARLQLSVSVDELPAGTKVLLRRITLSGQTAKDATLHIDQESVEGGTTCPVWSDHVMESRTIVIDGDEGNAQSYGRIDNSLRYMAELPYRWQPEGVMTTAANALYTTDRQTYVFLIPQPSLSLTVTVAYQKMTSTTSVPGVKTLTEPLVIAPLKGNTTYHLNIKLKDLP